MKQNFANVTKSLQLIERYGFGFTVITKSDLILRDLDLLKSINQKTKVRCANDFDDIRRGVCKKLEPNVCTTKRRVEVLEILRDNGIPTVVWLSPILPFINDTKENIEGILQYCIDAKVYGILCFGMGLTLRSGNREYFYAQLDRHFPGLSAKYRKIYGDSYIVGSRNNSELMKIFHSKCENVGIVHDNDEIFRYLSTFEEKSKFEQLKMF